MMIDSNVLKIPLYWLLLMALQNRMQGAHFFCVFVSLILITGCGGGGGGGSSTPVAAPQTPPPQQRAEVQTSQGLISGLLDNTTYVSASLHQRMFKRVRYAAAPVGELRFKAPEPPPMIEGTYDASRFGPRCPQIVTEGIVSGDEDCLFLNIWTLNDSVVRPVLLFLHGGGFVSGTASQSAFDGFWLAGNSFESSPGSDVVVVTVNYRLGALGFLAIDELIQENVRNTAGNWGLLDAIAALQWVRDNIGAFNGDPNRVMVFGQSSGGSAICHLLAAPEAAGLFAAAAIQSAPCGLRLVLNNTVAEPSQFAPVVELQRPFLAEAGCDQAADVVQCLRDLPFPAIIEAQARVPLLRHENRAPDDRTVSPFGAIIDGVVVQSNPYVALSDQTVGDIPIIVGATRDEAFTSDVLVPDDAAYRDLLAATYPDPLDDQLYAIYPTVEFPSARDAYLTLFGDAVFNCVAEELARSAQEGAPSYLYTLSHGFGQGAVHGIDIAYLFNNFDEFPDAVTREVKDGMQSAWAGLALEPGANPPYAAICAESEPCSNPASSWPTFDINDVRIVDFNDPIAVVNTHRAGRCAELRNLVTL